MLRRLLLVLLVVVLLAGPAGGDDLVQIDERLVDAGLTGAYVSTVPADRGSRVTVDFAAGSSSRSEYDRQAARAAELVWRHLEEKVQAVDVAPTTGVSWLQDQLPPAVSFTRADLVRAHGPRPAALDQAPSEDELVQDLEDEIAAGATAVVVAVLLGLVVVVALVAAVVAVVVTRRRRRPDAWASRWAAPSWQGAPWPVQPPSGPAVPPAQQPPGLASPPPYDPWRAPPG